ncbi:probable glutaminase [Lecanosticta acicola]|uniref:Probable glutaminase n=1 Tax=Lecanosticta acicola TaxID=111012 RepID=A0AAI8Z3N2_9PEZI|nr:probable glutaminase [Lecanosticta acicola]
MVVSSVVILSTLISVIAAQSAQQPSTFTPARPPAIPLAVRSPYLSTWQPAGQHGGNGGHLPGEWPTFWSGSVTGWCGLIRVDGETYNWMGKPEPLPALARQTAFEYTSTRSTFTLDVGGNVTMNVTFLSPVDPKDKQRQSMPVSYMTVAVQSSDGNPHDVAIYTDISAEWVSGDRSKTAQWNSGVAQGSSDACTGSLAYHKVWRQEQAEFAEDADQAAWGYWYYATQQAEGLTRQSGADVDVRKQFTDRGELANTEDTDFRAIDDRFPVFGFAKQLGHVSQHAHETLFTINLLQERAVQFGREGGVQQVPSYWTNTSPDELSALTTFYFDYRNGARVSAALDSDVATDARAAGGEDYVAITSLAVRQAWGALQLAGTEQDSYIFFKEVSSDGNVQTVDVIFPFTPILLYMNAHWMKMVLDPLFISMETPGLWPADFAIHDIGRHYPNATGHADGDAPLQPLEECGNMLIMTLAYARRTGDTAYLEQHWPSLDKWAQWLINNNSVIPFNQISTDDFAGTLANQTNLALKGIIGLQAASVMAKMTERHSEASDYANTASDWIKEWEQAAVDTAANPPHTVLSYGDEDSYSLLYNLYADALLETELVPTSIYRMQSNYYPTMNKRLGVPLDTRSPRVKSDWEMFCAAIAGPETREMFMRDLVTMINETPTSGPLTDLFDANTGEYALGLLGPFKARPVVGGFFSLLALNRIGIPNY